MSKNKSKKPTIVRRRMPIIKNKASQSSHVVEDTVTSSLTETKDNVDLTGIGHEIKNDENAFSEICYGENLNR